MGVSSEISIFSKLFIYSNFGGAFFGLSSVYILFESLYISHVFIVLFLFCFVICICVFTTSLGLAEKRNRFPQSLSPALYLYFRSLIFVLLNCESF